MDHDHHIYRTLEVEWPLANKKLRVRVKKGLVIDLPSCLIYVAFVSSSEVLEDKEGQNFI